MAPPRVSGGREPATRPDGTPTARRPRRPPRPRWARWRADPTAPSARVARRDRPPGSRPDLHGRDQVAIERVYMLDGGLLEDRAGQVPPHLVHRHRHAPVRLPGDPARPPPRLHEPPLPRPR